MTNDENLGLENQLSFIMYACSKEMIKHYKPYLKEIGLTYTQYIAMRVLWSGDNITVNELSKRLYLDSGTTTPLLKKLEIKGLLERVRDVSDERNVFIKLTKNGHELKDNMENTSQKVLDNTGVPMSEVDDILKSLKSVLDRVNNN
ncbi:MarR family transcriptional regulator [Romboutsia sedimentorum]|uniref:HTH-type transcriptional regulator SarZ n=1 Tax=Romboutsia sedimentorum TaxID=1368474 RepID=A0ABT7E664_9FIRM|nr:MarR family transcriptional regulator [Romboutsia sedimentorum]MDK2562425.1 MarR family transcriptional regulator [Romboutsia sedimentorum]